MNQFGRYGVWASIRLWPTEAGEVAAVAAEVESLGYGSLWIGGNPPDDLAFIETILSATSRLVVGTSIVDVWRSDPATIDASHHRLRDRYPGRFYLGLGAGHARMVEASGQTYTRPISKLRQYAASLSTPRDERLFAALGPNALAASRDVAGGALPYLVPPAHTADARTILGPDRLLVPEQKIFVGADPDIARAAGRRGTRGYLTLPNYLNNLRRYGLTDEDWEGDGSDRWVDTLVVWGDDDAIRTGVNAHFEAGADHVAIQALSATPGDHLPRSEWREAARILMP